MISRAGYLYPAQAEGNLINVYLNAERPVGIEPLRKSRKQFL
jgi:hypothetical protein